VKIEPIDEEQFKLCGGGFEASVSFANGPVFENVRVGNVELPDWKAYVGTRRIPAWKQADDWRLPYIPGVENSDDPKSIRVFKGVECVERTDRTALLATFATDDDQARGFLHWQADKEHDILECFWEIHNAGPDAIKVDSLSPWQFRAWTPDRSPTATYLTGSGEWFSTYRKQNAREYRLCRTTIDPGIVLRLEETGGMSAITQHPWLFLTWPNHGMTEDAFTMTVASAWSGNWIMEVENEFQRVRLRAGIGRPDTPVRIEAGTTERLPAVHVFFHEGGVESASNAMNRCVRARILPPERMTCVEEYPTLVHVHTFGNRNIADGSLVTHAQLVQAARTAAELGHFFFDLSVYTWVGNDHWWDYARLDKPDEDRFPPPGGLQAFCQDLHDMGLRVGFWVEPERISLKGGNEFREKFPDGILLFDERSGDWLGTDERSKWIRQDGMLIREEPDTGCGLADLGRDDIADWIFRKLDDLIVTYGIDGLFWDANYTFSSIHWRQQPKPMYRYYKNYYRILERLRKKHPDIRILLCAAGGTRIDMGMLRHAHALQMSDGIEPHLYLRQMWAASLILPIEMLERYGFTLCWPDWQGEDLIRYGRFILRVAMMGVFGSANVYETMSPEALDLLRKHNLFYRRELAPIISGADVYRLTDIPQLRPELYPRMPFGNSFTDKKYTDAQWFVLQEHNPRLNRHAIFVFRLHPNDDTITVRPKAIDPSLTYVVRDWDKGTREEVRGRELMDKGMELVMETDNDTAIILLAVVKGRTGPLEPVTASRGNP